MALFGESHGLGKMFSSLRENLLHVPPQPEKSPQTLEEAKNTKANESISEACDQLGLDANQREIDLGPVSSWEKSKDDALAWQKSIKTDTGNFTFIIREQPINSTPKPSTSESPQFEEELIITFIPNETTEANKGIQNVSVRKFTSDAGTNWSVSQVEINESGTNSVITLDPRKPETPVTLTDSEGAPQEITNSPMTLALKSFADNTEEDPWEFFTSVIEKINRNTPVTDLLPRTQEQSAEIIEPVKEIIIEPSPYAKELIKIFTDRVREYANPLLDAETSATKIDALIDSLGLPEDMKNSFLSDVDQLLTKDADKQNIVKPKWNLVKLTYDGVEARDYEMPDNRRPNRWETKNVVPPNMTELGIRTTGYETTRILPNQTELSFGVSVGTRKGSREFLSITCVSPVVTSENMDEVEYAEVNQIDGQYRFLTLKDKQSGERVLVSCKEGEQPKAKLISSRTNPIEMNLSEYLHFSPEAIGKILSGFVNTEPAGEPVDKNRAFDSIKSKAASLIHTLSGASN